MKICIIGGVAGGASAAARLRRLDEKAEIILFERGPFISFANCGLPYHLSGKISKRQSLLIQTPEKFNSRFNVDVRIHNEVIEIIPDKNILKVKSLDTNNIYEETYDKLIMSPGAEPFIPPLKGKENIPFLTLKTIPDMDKIIDLINKEKVKNAIVIGGGFIGIETAENLSEIGINTHIVELADQLMTPFDQEMAQILHEHIIENGISLHLSTKVNEITTNSTENVILDDGTKLSADLIVCAVGVKPEVSLAEKAGIKIGERGGIAVNSKLETSEKNIYAIGDAIEVENFISKEKILFPMAGPANRQGRIVADNICGIPSEYKSSQGTGIVKVFSLGAGCTGLNEKTLKAQKTNYKTIYLFPASHASYYPESYPISIKFLYSPDTGQILGTQAIGKDGADKYVDTIATCIRGNIKVEELVDMELCYAPPFGSAKSPANMIGFIAENDKKGLSSIISVNEISSLDNPFIIDVRTPTEFSTGSIPDAINIPVDSLRNHLHEIPKDRTILITCQVGLRGHVAVRILKENGFDKIYNLSGGMKIYRFFNPNPDWKKAPDLTTPNTEVSCSSPCMMNIQPETHTLDLCGLQCPGPVIQLKHKLDTIKDGDKIVATLNDPGFVKDAPAFCNSTGNTLVNVEQRNNIYQVIIQKGCVKKESSNKVATKKKTFLVFSGDLDKAFAAMVLANGARAMGNEVTLFFAFWGINILRDSKLPQSNNKSLLDKMFGWMMPKGAAKLKLSNMNMMGMGTEMMKYVMKEKNVDSLPEMVKHALDSGVNMVACSMSMDVMGIREEELIKGVQIGGVAHFLSESEQSDVSFMI